MSNVFDPKAFWQFSVNLYAREGVKDYCLSLQNDHAVDINLLLLCCWLDEQGYKLPEETLDNLINVAGHWQHSVLGPLRANRDALNKNSEDYTSALAAELTIEAKEQQALIDLINLAEIKQEKSLLRGTSNYLAYASAAQFPVNSQAPLFSAYKDN